MMLVLAPLVTMLILSLEVFLRTLGELLEER